MAKPEVRGRAAEYGLALAEKPDSQEICFVPNGDYKQFLDSYLAEQGEALPDTAGGLVSASGGGVGGEEGRHNLPVGERQGLGGGTGGPLCVFVFRGGPRQGVGGGGEGLYFSGE